MKIPNRLKSVFKPRPKPPKPPKPMMLVRIKFATIRDDHDIWADNFVFRDGSYFGDITCYIDGRNIAFIDYVQGYEVLKTIPREEYDKL